MRQRGRHRWGVLLVRCIAVVILCATGGSGSAQVPPAAPAASDGAPGAAAPNAWATGGVSGTAGGAGTAVPYWQATALPKAVIQGGAIPAGWSPQSLPYQGVGPDGRPLTMYYAPTYVFTYPIGPPVLAAATGSNLSQVNRRQARPAAPPPASMQGWSYQTQAVPQATYTLPPATVARYQPVPYQYPAGSPALKGTPIVPPPGMPEPTAVAAVSPPAASAFQAPQPQPPLLQQPMQPPPDQWAASTEAAPPMVAGTAAAIATATQAPPAAAFPAPIAPSSTPAQNVSVAPPQAPAGRSTGPHLWRVVGVHDGDTITCLDESNQQQKVRLASIDAPEIGQDYGKVSREVLAEMVFGKTVEVTDEGKDSYGRWIGRLSSNGIDVNRQMVATGNAWHYADYSRDTSLAALQSQAQSQRLGLWAQPNPVAPWDFRHNGPR